jgi:hypothetical protein
MWLSIQIGGEGSYGAYGGFSSGRSSGAG